jgi:thiamine biosynthesis lipoprotein
MKFSRRRFLAIAAAVPTLGLGSRPAAATRWVGTALGASAAITLFHPDSDAARRALTDCRAEIARLEDLFSLHHENSALSRLNRKGGLTSAPPDLNAVVSRALDFGRETGGAFDITVQPLWNLYANHFSSGAGDGIGPDPAALEATRALVGQSAVRVDGSAISLVSPGMALTLNGIAQGYITDRVTEMLRRHGISQVYVDMGETRVLGTHADGRPWRVGLRDPINPARITQTLPLADRALATSGGYGTRFDPRHHHLFDPRTGRCANHYLAVSVLAPDATTADALSTGLYAMSPDEAMACVEGFNDVGALFTLPDGRLLRRGSV